MTRPDIAPVTVTAITAERRAAPYLLALPALLLFVGIVLIPIGMTVLLSFHDWGQYKGIEPVLILKNWKEVGSDGYFHEMFLRTFRIAVLITLLAAIFGAPEAYILSRIVLPQIVPGILSGGIIVFALAASAFATPAIIGGRRLKVASTLAYDEFLNTLNWPLGAAVATLLLIALASIIVGCNRLVERRFAEVFR